MKRLIMAMGQLIIFLGMSLGMPAFARQIVFPQGPERELNATDFFRHTPTDNKYDEIWRYNFVFL